MDGSQKLPQRTLGTLGEALDRGRTCPGLVLAVAAWMRYVGGVDEAGNPIDVRDPMAARLRKLSQSADDPAGKVAALLGVTEVFPRELAAQLQQPVTAAYVSLLRLGARAAAEEVIR